MISGGLKTEAKAAAVDSGFLNSITRLAKAGLEGAEAGLKGGVVREVADVFEMKTTTLLQTPESANKAFRSSAKAFGNVDGYVGSIAKDNSDKILQIASFLPGLSLPAQGAVLAGLVKKVFDTEGGKNE